MPSPQGGKMTPIESAGLIPTFVNRVKNTISGITGSSFFGPGQPLKPIAPADTSPRLFDYPYGHNLFFTPRSPNSESGVSFQDLRYFADNLDLVRLVIETRKDQICKMNWSFKPVEGKVGLKTEDRFQRKAEKYNKFFKYPDGQRGWQTWLRELLEDMFVIDAPTICPRKTNGGDIIALDIIDGSTINRLIDINGRTPIPPNPAYQQIIKGLPAVDLTADDIIYVPRNVRANKIYGYSPVEQILVITQLAIRRQLSQLSYYTEGNIPEGLAEVPETWSADEIVRFQNMFDQHSGDPRFKRTLRFVPALHRAITMTKDMVLKDEMDEWLARVICYAFSVSPTPFTKAVNRATAQVATESALAEGLLPTLRWVEEVINLILIRYFKEEDVEFGFLIDQETDGLKKAQIHKIYLGMGVISKDDVRADIGYPRLGGGFDTPKPLDPALMNQPKSANGNTDNGSDKAGATELPTTEKKGNASETGEK